MIDSVITGKNLINAQFTENTPSVRIYNKTFTYYRKINSIKELVDVLGLNIYRRKDMKSYYTEIGNTLGISAKEALRWYNAVAYKTFVASIDNFHVRKFALNPLKKSIVSNHISRIHKVKSQLDQIKSDNIYNIAPFVFTLNKNPQELRQFFGKGMWKSLCKNSFARNKLLETYLGFFSVKDMPRLNSIPSGILFSMKRTNCSLETLEWLTKNCKGKYTNKTYINTAANLVRDTVRMGQQLNQQVSMNWNYERFVIEHERLIQLQRRIYFNNRNSIKNNDEFPYSKNLKSFCEIVDGVEYTAIPLIRPSELSAEGQRMHHCVGGYAPDCQRGLYVVYSMRINGVPYSTLGIHIINGRYLLNQHYKACNQEVDDVMILKIANLVINELNKAVDKESNMTYDHNIDTNRYF